MRESASAAIGARPPESRLPPRRRTPRLLDHCTASGSSSKARTILAGVAPEHPKAQTLNLQVQKRLARRVWHQRGH